MSRIMYLPDANMIYFGPPDNPACREVSNTGRDLVATIKKQAEESGKIKEIDHTCGGAPACDLTYVLEILEGEAKITLDYFPAHDAWTRSLKKGDCAAAYPQTMIEIEAKTGFKAKVYVALLNPP